MSESKPTLRREQIAGMNIHYIMWSLDYFLDVQQRLGFESIELWCAEPHVTLDHTGYFEAEVLAKKAADRGLRYRTLCPEESNLVTTVSDAKRMIDEVASPYLQPMVDTTAMGVAGETLEDWFATFGDGAIHEMHFIDGDPYGHLVWGDGKHDMDAFVATLNVHGFDGMLGQEITDGRYYDDPAAADAKNMAAFEKYLID